MERLVAEFRRRWLEAFDKEWAVNGRTEAEQMAAEHEARNCQRWIPVSERLPKEYETVLVATDGDVSAGEVRFPDGECGMDEPWWMVFKDRRNRVPITWAGLVRLSDVTHWMPLPPPPPAVGDLSAR